MMHRYRFDHHFDLFSFSVKSDKGDLDREKIIEIGRHDIDDTVETIIPKLIKVRHEAGTKSDSCTDHVGEFGEILN